LAGLDELAERRVQGRRLAAARRTGDEDQPFRAAYEVAEVFEDRRAHPQRRELEPQRSLIENAQHDLLAMNRRIRGRAEVEAALAERDRQAAVLRKPVFGDVHAGEHLQARADRRRDGWRNDADVLERPVDAKPHAKVLRGPLEMAVAR